PMSSDKVPEPKELTDMYEIIPQGESAERIADKWDISRQELDELAVRSHKLANEAQTKGLFDREILPIEIEVDGKKVLVNQDEGIRPNSTVEKLANLKTVFREDGKVTAGNSSQISDGASAILVMSREKAEELGLKPRAKII